MQSYHKQKLNWLRSGANQTSLSRLPVSFDSVCKNSSKKGLDSRKVTKSLRLLKKKVDKFWKHALAEPSAFCSANIEDENRKFVCSTRWQWRRNMFLLLNVFEIEKTPFFYLKAK